MVGFDISEFRSGISNSYHRSSHFRMEIVGPNGLSLEGGVSEENRHRLIDASMRMSFEIEATNLPGVAMGTDDIRRQGFGPFSKMPYAPIFDTIDITVRSDSDGKLYDFFQTWMKLVINYDYRHGMSVDGGLGARSNITSPPGVYEVQYKERYRATSIISLFDELGEEPTIELTMIDCYPIHLGNVPLNWSSNDIVKFPVTLTFKDWYQKREFKSNNSINTTGR